MDPLTVGLIAILGKYALDKAAEIIPVVGAEASRMITLIYNLAIGEVSSEGDKEKMVAENFAADPETYEKPFAKLLDDAINSNPVFANHLRELVNNYNNLIDSQNKDHRYKIGVKGDFWVTGSVFGSGTVSAGGDIIGGIKKP